MRYYLKMEETIEVTESYQIVLDETTDAEFIKANKDLLDKCDDADVANELWYKALDAGIADEYLDREILDSIETYYSAEKWEDN